MVVGPPLIKLPDQVIEDLATDQHYAKNVCTIRDGVLPVRLPLLEIGPVNHSHLSKQASWALGESMDLKEQIGRICNSL